MLAAERQQRLLDDLRTFGRISAADAADALGTSTETIRKFATDLGLGVHRPQVRVANHRFGGNQGDPNAVFDGAQQVRDGVGFEDAPPMEARFLARDVDPCAERRVGAILSELTVGKVTQANSSAVGERVAMVDGEHERLRNQGPLVQVGSLERAIGHCDVEVSGNHIVMRLGTAS